MGSLFRSEDMTLCQLYLQTEAAYDIVSQLGELGIVQFKDLNTEINAFHKKFVLEIRRTEEMERQLRYFEKELEKDSISIVDNGSNPEAPAPRDMIDLEAQFEKHESEIRELGNNIEALKQNYSELTELQHVLKHTDTFLLESAFSFLSDQSSASETSSPQADIELDTMRQAAIAQSQMDPNSRTYLGYVAGVISRERMPGFMRLMWFACRGNVFLREAEIEEPIEEPHTGDLVHKTSFMVFFQGEQLKSRVKKICEGFKATLYPVPESADERQEMKLGVLTRLLDLEHVLTKSQEQRRRVLESVAKNLRPWFIKVLKIKAIYFTMNMFSTEGKNYLAECWLPVAEISTVHMVLKKAGENAGTSAPSLLHPIQSDKLPTYHRTNKFTYAFQVITDSYGVANYKEVNPAPFAIISFPFLFAVMFGDAGHAIIMLLFALFLVIRERQLEKLAKANDLFGPIYYGRYIILLMSLFSLYTGLIYNDMFSKSLNIFGSSWTVIYDSDWITAHEKLQLDPNDTRVYSGSMYPFGMDPIWQISRNKITWTNSFKEKISVIIGVTQMFFGIILSLFNHVYFRQYINIWTEFIPMVLFLMGIFGYLCGLIFQKWIVYGASQSGCAPDILIAFINMFLMKYPKDGDGTPCSGQMWYSGQKGFQIFLVIMCVFCALWLLLAKPLYLRYRHNHRTLVSHSHRRRHHTRRGYDQIVEVDGFTDMGESSTDPGDDDKADIIPESNIRTVGTEEEFDFGEIFIHQSIHTIEFCLGCISHTASYLRLWALSLAHSQLSEVLWNMILRIGLRINHWWGSILVFYLFAFWAMATLAILLGMEGLSAFLHTLRLHWVEFQSKFYKAEGSLFVPFNFTPLLDDIPKET